MSSSIFMFLSIQIIYLVGLFMLMVIPKYNTLLLKKASLTVSYILLFIIILMGVRINAFELTLAPLSLDFGWINTGLANFNYSISIDSLSYVFMLLSALLIPLCIISSWNNIKFNLKDFFIILITVEWMLLNMFSVVDLFLFYIWFEAILIPMFILIGIWGSRQRKTYAAFMFFFYTFVGSLFLLFGLFLMYTQYGSLQLFTILMNSQSAAAGFLIWPLMMFAFAVKVPMFPAHIWLPEAHVEAPTVGSVLLAGVLLKLGIFAVLRFLIPIFPVETQYFAPLVSIFALIGILYISLTTIRQIDLKKIIAYASVAHMNYVVLGVLGTNAMSLSGSIFLMVGHGIVSAGLFFMVGFLYDRYKTRNIRYYRGLVSFMPLYALFLFVFSLANMSFPGTCNFIGEAIILFGVIQNNIFVAWIAAVGIIFCAVYTIWLFNRTMYGPITPMITTFADLSFKEMFVLTPLLILTIYLGIFPNYLISQILDLTWLTLENY
jgi:NADH-quinone oxidoreductase subunit M